MSGLPNKNNTWQMLFCKVGSGLYLAGGSYLLCFQDLSMKYLHYACIQSNNDNDNDDDDCITLQL